MIPNSLIQVRKQVKQKSHKIINKFRLTEKNRKTGHKVQIGSMSSEIIVKSYTSRLDVGNSEGSIVIRTNEYNKDDFQVSYPSAKFFVIKPINEADVHKSIKYGVWSTSLTGNKKLDSAKIFTWLIKN
jgi:restriction endonuclease Mrr